MKNIYITGVPRSGKSTLSKIIKERFPLYNQISFEAIRNGFIKSQPELNMGNRNSDARKNILPSFIIEFLEWNTKFTKNPFLMEGDFINLKDLLTLVNKDSIIICLGHGGKSIDEIYQNHIKYDNDLDYTLSWSKERFFAHFQDIETQDLLNKQICEEFNIFYYDTSTNREKIYETILSNINKELNKEDIIK